MNTNTVIACLSTHFPGPTPSVAGQGSGKYAQIYKLFAHALSRRLKFPKITLQTADGSVVVLRVAGKKSKWPGQIQILSDGQYGLDRLYFGRINETGNLFASVEMTAQVQQLLDALAADPLKIAFEYGKATGQCCFCRKPLTDARSSAHGYGPVCARSYGLVWNANRDNHGFQRCQPELPISEGVSLSLNAISGISR